MISRITDGSELLVRRPPEDPKNARISALAWDATGARLAFGAESGDAGLLDTLIGRLGFGGEVVTDS